MVWEWNIIVVTRSKKRFDVTFRTAEKQRRVCWQKENETVIKRDSTLPFRRWPELRDLK